MTWDSFYFQCRYFAQKISPRCDVQQARKNLKADYPASPFSQSLKPQSMADDLMTELLQLPDIEHQKKQFTLYAELPLNWVSSSVKKLGERLSYLTLLIALFALMSTIYHNIVAPEMVSLFKLSETPVEPALANYAYYWAFTLIALLTPYVLLLMLNTQIKRIETSPHLIPNTIITKLVLSTKAHNQLQHCTAIVYAPLARLSNQHSAQHIALIEQFKLDKLNVAQELSTHLSHYQHSLTATLNQRIRILMAVSSCFVFIGIFNFVYSLYTPIFAIGTII